MADWQEEKRRVLEEAHCIVFKVGSAVITDDQGLSLDVIDRLADQIAAVSVRRRFSRPQRMPRAGCGTGIARHVRAPGLCCHRPGPPCARLG